MPIPKNALAYIRDVSETNQRQMSEIRAANTANAQEDARRRATQARIRKMMAPKPKPPGPRYENVFRRTPEAVEAERQADELLRIRKERRNAFGGM